MKAFRIALLLVMVMGAYAFAQQEAKIEKFIVKPDKPKTGDEITVEVKLSDQSSRGEVRWYVGEEERGFALIDNFNTDVNVTGDFKAGDNLRIEVTPFDMGGLAGSPQSKTISFKNSPPEVELKGQQIKGNTYEAKIDAVDPEGGEIEFALLEAPEGMEIDQTGRITWKMAEDESGSYKIVAMAKDDAGQEVRVNLSFSIKRKKIK